MNVTRRNIILILLLLVLSMPLYAQKVKTVSATYTYHASETTSLDEAKRIAFDRAKIEAIANEFGTVVSQNSSTIVSNLNGNTSEQFYYFGGSEVKGEWIETLGDPGYEIQYVDHTLVVTCSVKGKARELKTAKIELTAKLLRNGTDLRFEANEFKDGDDMYLYFLSPINGNVAVYLLDEVSNRVYSILPYKRQNSITSLPVEANKENIFFSKKAVEKEFRAIVDEYSLSCENEKEFNTLYILFSTSEIGKGGGYENITDNEPNSTTYKEFKQWLSKCLSKDEKIQLVEIGFTISGE